MRRFAFTSLMAAGLLVGGMNAQEIRQRAENQQDRIAQGVKSGQLTAGETANLERKEARLDRKVVRTKNRQGGTLTAKQKAEVNHRQNQLSRQIYSHKHNDRTQ
ncbi:MAG TPA: hypothetical protein VLX58_01830 [Bryobacteraceae bacterium]|nr:hypothetical protein [Bryobacteraceae bacterium]